MSTYWANFIVWPFFFGIGLQWRIYEKKIASMFSGRKILFRTLAIALFLVIYGMLMIRDTKVSYWGWYSLVFELLAMIVFQILCEHCMNNTLISYIGRNTFFIYLTHMQIVGLINTRLPQNGFFYLIKPLIGLAVMLFLLIAARKMLRVMRLENFAVFIGIRM